MICQHNLKSSFTNLIFTFLSLDLILETLVEDPEDVGQPDVVRAVLWPAGVLGQTADQGGDVISLEKRILKIKQIFDYHGSNDVIRFSE